MKEMLKALAVACLAYFAPTKSVILTTTALVFIDLVFGLMASHKQNIPITSNGLKTTVVKLLVYTAAILLSYVVQQQLTGDDYPVMKWVSAMVGLVELKSILENLDIVSGGGLLSQIIAKINSMLNPPA